MEEQRQLVTVGVHIGSVGNVVGESSRLAISRVSSCFQVCMRGHCDTAWWHVPECDRAPGRRACERLNAWWGWEQVPLRDRAAWSDGRGGRGHTAGAVQVQHLRPPLPSSRPVRRVFCCAIHASRRWSLLCCCFLRHSPAAAVSACKRGSLF